MDVEEAAKKPKAVKLEVTDSARCGFAGEVEHHHGVRWYDLVVPVQGWQSGRGPE